MNRSTFHRSRARRSRHGCLDMGHRHADIGCAYCDRAGDIVDTAIRQYARTTADEVYATYGWES
jgi:hypothetical protein